jgi:hypothetical protein
MLKDDRMQKKSEKIILTLYLLGFLALALTIALLQPWPIHRPCSATRPMSMRDI